jgi:hypothetical protein
MAVNYRMPLANGDRLHLRRDLMGWDLGDKDAQCPRWDHTLRHGLQELEASQTEGKGRGQLVMYP